MLVDYYGRSAAAKLSAIGFAASAIDGPLPVGDIVGAICIVVAVAIIGDASTEVGEYIADALPDAQDSTTAPPQSIEEPSSETDTKSQDKAKPSSPGKMNEEVKRGQAPKEVQSVHNAHDTKTGKPHVHFKDKTSMNNDGTPHDAHRGEPRLTKPVRDWLKKHHWATKYNIFP